MPRYSLTHKGCYKPIEIGNLAEGVKVLKLSNAALESSREQKTVILGDYYTL